MKRSGSAIEWLCDLGQALQQCVSLLLCLQNDQIGLSWMKALSALLFFASHICWLSSYVTEMSHHGIITSCF